MTQAELDALPEDGTFAYTTEVRDGQTVRVPRFQSVGALYQPPDEPCLVTDTEGQRWILGYAQGQRWKRRLG